MSVVGSTPAVGLAPLFRWPGGKRWLIPHLKGVLPNDHGRYFEPFFGGGALFFAIRPKLSRLSDSNHDLMACYQALRQHPEQVGRILRALPRGADAYYEVRAARPTSAIERAARLIYLTTLAFNGIYRVNRQGEFNVPYGGRTYEGLGANATLLKYAEALAGAEITSGDFEHGLDGVERGDLVYLDPPYTVAHSNNGFMRYNEKIFSWADQQRLAQVAASLALRGAYVIVSNANHPSIRELYEGFDALVVERPSAMAADIKRRGIVEELILTNG